MLTFYLQSKLCECFRISVYTADFTCKDCGCEFIRVVFLAMKAIWMFVSSCDRAQLDV